MGEHRYLTESELRIIVEESGSLSLQLGPLEVEAGADTGQPFDILYAPVVSDGLERLSSRISRSRFGGSQPDRPLRVVIAHLKRGKGQYYAGDKSLCGPPIHVATVVYSGPDGRETRAQVWPSADELADDMMGKIDLAWHGERTEKGTLKAVWDNEGGVQKKDQYGENARRALAGESLIAKRQGEDRPIAEKTVEAKRVPVPQTAKRVALPVAKKVEPKTAEEVFYDGQGNPIKADGTPVNKPAAQVATKPQPAKRPPATPVAKRPTPPAAPRPPVTPKPPEPPKAPESPKPSPAPMPKPATPTATKKPEAPKPTKPAHPEENGWIEEYRGLKNRKDMGQSLKPDEQKRLDEMDTQLKEYAAQTAGGTKATPKPEPKSPPEPKPAAPKSNPLADAAAKHLKDEPELKKLVDGLDEAEKGGYHREALFDLYSRFWGKDGRGADHPFAPVIQKELKERYGAEPFHTDHFADLPDGWVQPAKGSKVMTGQIGKVVRPGLKDASGKLLVPMIADIE